MLHPFMAENFENRQKKYLHVEHQGSIVQIIDIELNLNRNRQFIPTVNLCPTGNSGNKMMNAFLRSQLNEIFLVKQRRPRSNETHIPF